MAGTLRACRTTPLALLPSLTCSSLPTDPKRSSSCSRMATTSMSRLQVGPSICAQMHALVKLMLLLNEVQQPQLLF